MSRFPFGRPATRRPPRTPVDRTADLVVLGVYPSALHIRWTLPDRSASVSALAVDDEPTVFRLPADLFREVRSPITG
jgi:hypothetical protein